MRYPGLTSESTFAEFQAAAVARVSTCKDESAVLKPGLQSTQETLLDLKASYLPFGHEG